jgi:hypothetical protein
MVMQELIEAEATEQVGTLRTTRPRTISPELAQVPVAVRRPLTATRRPRSRASHAHCLGARGDCRRG